MTDQTPTPDTLRAAAQAVVRAYIEDEPLSSRIDHLAAALAASPAPTDSPDERWEYATTTGPRKAWDDEMRPPDDRPGWEPDPDQGRPGQSWDRFDYHEERYWRRPAAVTAPREDEHALCWGDLPCSPECPVLAAAAPAVAAPAVERATPDPDTLAALLLASALEANGAAEPMHPVTLEMFNALAKLQARALIAAGVTLNETATTPTQEDAK